MFPTVGPRRSLGDRGRGCFWSFVPVVLGVGFGLLLSGCSSGGGGGGGSSNLRVLGLDVDEQTTIFRNQPLKLSLSGPVDPDSVTRSAIQVVGGVEGVLRGRAVVQGREILFYPTSWDGVDDSGVDQSVDHFVPPMPLAGNAGGFTPGVRYEIRLPGESSSSLRGLNGRPLAESFVGSFIAGREYLPEKNPESPRLTRVVEFNQPFLNLECDPDPTLGDESVDCGETSGSVPLPLLDPTNVQFSFRFSEPISLAELERSEAVRVLNVSTGRKVAGVSSLSGDQLELEFRPLTSLGDRVDSSEPYLFRVELSERITDLAGNPLFHNPDLGSQSGPVVDPLVFRFRTADKPGEINTASIEELFLTTEKRGPGSTARWEGTGELLGSPIRQRDVEIAPTTTTFLLPHPLAPQGFRIQHLVLGAALRAGDDRDGRESIVGISWGPQSNFVFQSSYPRVRIRVGHTNVNGRPATMGLNFNFASNYAGFGDNPKLVYDGPYETPNSVTSVFHPWPDFQSDFEYDGRSNVVLDYDVAPGGDTFQLFRNASSAVTPRYRVFGPPGAANAGGGGMLPPGGFEIYHHRIRIHLKRSRAISLPYDTGVTSPDYVLARVVADESRVGAKHEVRFIGYRADAMGLPDLSTPLGPFEDIEMLDGVRFFRFVVDMESSLETGFSPRIESVLVLFRVP